MCCWPAHADLADESRADGACLTAQGVPWLHSLCSPACCKIRKMSQTLLKTLVDNLLSLNSSGQMGIGSTECCTAGACGVGIRFGLNHGQSASSGPLMCPLKALWPDSSMHPFQSHRCLSALQVQLTFVAGHLFFC